MTSWCESLSWNDWKGLARHAFTSFLTEMWYTAVSSLTKLISLPVKMHRKFPDAIKVTTLTYDKTRRLELSCSEEEVKIDPANLSSCKKRIHRMHYISKCYAQMSNDSYVVKHSWWVGRGRGTFGIRQPLFGSIQHSGHYTHHLLSLLGNKTVKRDIQVPERQMPKNRNSTTNYSFHTPRTLFFCHRIIRHRIVWRTYSVVK